MLILLDFLSSNRERYHWIKFVGVCDSIVEFDVNDGVSLSVP